MEHEAISTDEARGMAVDDLYRALSSRREGLSQSEANDRIRTYGYNELPEKEESAVKKFLRYFWGPIPWMIEAALIISAAIGRWEDFAIILALLLVNAIVGFWQERQAGNAIAMLKQRLALEARVLRDGKWQKITARDLVPGDIVRVRNGDIIPADIKLVEGDFLSADESALTGESMPVEKHASDTAYSGSTVKQGEMTALVVATGDATFFGRTARLAGEAVTTSHFRKAVVRIGDYLIVLAVALVTVVFIVSLIRQESILDTLQFALVLVVAAIPAAMPAVLSITMAVGATALARKEAIVSRLVAIEEMAGVDVLCTDKTGTITENRLTLAEVVPFEGFGKDDVLLAALLASREEDRDPIDIAIIESEDAQGLRDRLSSFTVTGFKPFDPVAKRTEATVRGADGREFSVAKGAPQVILALAGGGKDLTETVDRLSETFAGKGYRMLGVARSDAPGAWAYAGVLGLHDPPRADSAATIGTAAKMGLDVKMVTGDHVAIAREVAREVGLRPEIATADAFVKESDPRAAEIVEQAAGFAEVFPEHKYRIVSLLQSRGHIVGMTGDGVNDAPALKKADVGIAVAGATDAAKSAAAIVLTKPGLSVIIDAIKESRMIFERMTHYVTYRIAETIRVLFFITLSILIFGFFPITALMIVLLALLNDIPIMTIAWDNVLYSRSPERWKMREILTLATIIGFVGVVSSFTMLAIAQGPLNLPLEVIRSLIFLKLAVAGHLTVFVARTRGPFWSVRPAPVLLGAVIVTQTVATLITVYGVFIEPIGWPLAAFVWVYALIWALVITDPVKVYAYRLIDHAGIRFAR
ncbi:MAG: plasma-membrane proton-efflux P-type ATPase [Methanoculleus sp.]|uniref:plasma-membrane proton-efflux P-type ATPase n=1 Tax=unclassified Methanoculleus TaxID=2619537 RepID=UPI0025D1436B|nr:MULTISPECIES: plasma-membrane proton-efflux P-type ATPase [unclassified Methanoculleus]MDD3216666.1 plasma-membrane proton-efflux P-type ATPase [Methanoculleus sp.]MDD4315006.1 plasma-membrane proton-efflux P-type ATPase [Methanoculleus sp.]MDD4470547.1 plasma-membrane proton-efflux P-type ATPase [Methanoculleus sp.]